MGFGVTRLQGFYASVWCMEMDIAVEGKLVPSKAAG